MLPVLVTVVTVAFFVAKWTPGGPFDAEKTVSAAVEARLNAYYGMDKPLLEQYWQYVSHVFRGNLGPSTSHAGKSVQSLLLPRIPLSLGIGFISVSLAGILGIALGLIAAYKPNSLRDASAMSFALIGICLPSFVVGPLLILVFGFKLKWFNVMGLETWKDAVLPILTLALMYSGNIARLTRGSMMEVRNSEYLRTARAKGLGPIKTFVWHGFRNALIPVVTYIGPIFAAAMSGTLVIEMIFNLPGVGRLFLDAIMTRDDGLMLGTVLFFAVLVLVFNLIVDLLLVALNPKNAL